MVKKRGFDLIFLMLLFFLCTAWVGKLFAQAEVSFRAARRDFEVGGPPTSVAVGDFNGDKIQDVVTVSRETISILLGNGDGTFALARNLAVGSNPGSIIVGDFNGDEFQDLAVANQGAYPNPSTVSVLLGNGDGKFRSPRHFVVGRYPSSLIAGDFNGDTIPDLAVTIQSTNDVSILLGNGDGTFAAARNFAVGSFPGSIAVGDFDGDNVQDLAVTNAGTGDSPGTTVSLLMGNGDGTFRPARDFQVGRGPIWVAAGDFNADAIQDLAVISYYYPAIDGGLSILLGNGDGTFAPAQILSIATYPSSVTVGDFNGDEVPDLVVTYSRPYLSLLLGNGDGTFRFGGGQGLLVGRGARSVAVGDFNGDSVQDLAVANSFGCPGGPSFMIYPCDGIVSILLGHGDGTFGSAQDLAGSYYATSVSASDFNGDKILDLAVVNSLTRGTVSILLGNGDGTFGAAQNFGVGLRPQSIAVADFNGDKLPDLAVANEGSPPSYEGTVSILLGRGDGTFGPAQNFGVGRGPRFVAVGDFNGDEIPDLAVANWGHTRCMIHGGCVYIPDTRVSILLGWGDGTFGSVQNLEAGRGPLSIAIEDFDGDSIQDLAVGTGSILLGNGDGTFRHGQDLLDLVGSGSITTADFNGDSIPDLAVGRAVRLGNGDGTFQRPLSYRARGGTIAISDFNEDSIPDLLTVDRLSNNLSILLGHGDGTFGPAHLFGVGEGPSYAAVGDFNGDTMPDLAVVYQYWNSVSILINDSHARSDGDVQTLPPEVRISTGR